MPIASISKNGGNLTRFACQNNLKPSRFISSPRLNSIVDPARSYVPIAFAFSFDRAFCSSFPSNFILVIFREACLPREKRIELLAEAFYGFFHSGECNEQEMKSYPHWNAPLAIDSYVKKKLEKNLYTK